MKIVSFSMQIILNVGDISKIVQIGSKLCVTYFLFYKIFTRPFCILKNVSS